MASSLDPATSWCWSLPSAFITALRQVRRAIALTLPGNVGEAGCGIAVSVASDKHPHPAGLQLNVRKPRKQ
jgi:hypothetical protein